MDKRHSLAANRVQLWGAATPEKEGFLMYKKSKWTGGTVWKRRWVTLTGLSMHCYKDKPKDQAALGIPVDTVDLSSCSSICTVVEGVGSKLDSAAHRIVIVGERTYLFGAAEESDAQSWVVALQATATSFRLKVEVTAISMPLLDATAVSPTDSADDSYSSPPPVPPMRRKGPRGPRGPIEVARVSEPSDFATFQEYHNHLRPPCLAE